MASRTIGLLPFGSVWPLTVVTTGVSHSWSMPSTSVAILDLGKLLGLFRSEQCLNSRISFLTLFLHLLMTSFHCIFIPGLESLTTRRGCLLHGLHLLGVDAEDLRLLLGCQVQFLLQAFNTLFQHLPFVHTGTMRRLCIHDNRAHQGNSKC